MTQETAKSEAPQQEALPAHEKASPLFKPQKTPFLLRTLPLWVIVMAVVFWAFKGKIPVEVSGKTILVAPRSNIPVQTRSGGQVVQLKIRPGDPVTVGQVLAILDLPELKDQLISQQQKLRELQAQKQDLTQVQARTTGLQKQNLQSQRSTIPQQIQAIQEQIVANQREMAASHQQIAVKQTEIQGYRQRISQLKERTAILETRLESGQMLVVEGAIAPLAADLIQAQKQVQDNEIQMTQMEVQSNDAQAKIEQLRAELVGNQAKEKDFLNQIRNLKAQFTGLGAQLEKVEYDTLQTNTNQDNQILDLQREIQNLRVRLETDSKILSPRAGKILELSVNRGQVIQSGSRLATIEESPHHQESLGYIFFAVGEAEKIRPQMLLQIVPDVEDRERYGGIVAKVIAVSRIPSTSQEVTSILGNEELTKQVTGGDKPVIKVIAQLKRDPNTISGLRWTRGSGVPYVLPENTLGTAYGIVEERSLVSHLTPLLRKLTGIEANAN